MWPGAFCGMVWESEMSRIEFETWITASPYERSVEKWPDDANNFAWPDQYKDHVVQIAWDAWNESLTNHREQRK